MKETYSTKSKHFENIDKLNSSLRLLKIMLLGEII
jgi:hypothetical protein